jgi:hypothetical protein
VELTPGVVWGVEAQSFSTVYAGRAKGEVNRYQSSLMFNF